MNQLSVYTRAQNGDVLLLDQFEDLSFEDKKRCVGTAAQFGQCSWLEQLAQRCDLSVFAEHAVWLAAHDKQFKSVKLFLPLLSPTSVVWESVLRYCIKHDAWDLQNTILSLEPPVSVNSCLPVAADKQYKPLMITLLQRCDALTARVVVQMLENAWSDLVERHAHRLSSPEKNKLFCMCVERSRGEDTLVFEVCKHDLNYSVPNALAAAILSNKWELAEKLLPYCDLPTAVRTVEKNRPDQSVREGLQRLVLLNAVGGAEYTESKRKI